MDKRLIAILRQLQEEHGPEKGLAIFEQINDQIMITIEQTIAQANKEIRVELEQLKSENRQTKWVIGIIIGIATILITLMQIGLQFLFKSH